MKYFVVLLLAASAAFAQEFRSTIAGRVIDPSGSAVVNVKVVAAETQTGAKYEAPTGQGGEYTLPFLPPGPYTITAEITWVTMEPPVLSDNQPPMGRTNAPTKGPIQA